MRCPYTTYKLFDRYITEWMARYGVTLLRISLGVIFFWFGVLKFVPGLSPAHSLAGRTIEVLTFGVVQAHVSVPVLALWECLIGIGLITNFAMRATLLLLFAQMCGTVTPIFLFPGEVFTAIPYAPTLEGQYIIKNIVIISGAIVVGATVRGGRMVADPTYISEPVAHESRHQKTPTRAPFPPAVLALVMVSGLAAPCFGQGSNFYSGPAKQARQDSETPAALRQVRFEQRLNEQIPFDAVFKDEAGQADQLGRYFNQRPVVLALVYYECPMLCNQVLNGLVSSLKVLNFDAGRDFDVVAISFDSRENERPGLAASKKQSYVDRYSRSGTDGGWHFLTGTEDQIKRVTDAVGFHFAFDSATNQFAHASGITVLTPEGGIARYFYGIEYAPKDLRLGLIEASNNKIGSPVEQLLLYCYHYDPSTGKYGAVVMNILKLFSVVFLITTGAFFIMLHKLLAGRMKATRVT